ncbi:Chemotaxis protein CheY [Rickettsiales bacterium Ac37b]|nr:Chemotaxis protein CheY [Rickettsiales bacterium Ac37b]
MKSCMIVDDSKVVRKFARRIVEELGFSVSEAGDGQEALSECEKNLPDVILLDWNMPNVDGLQFLNLFRKHQKWSHVIVIFCTTENELPKIKEALGAGANEYIMKPFDLEVVKNKFIQTGVL